MFGVRCNLRSVEEAVAVAEADPLHDDRECYNSGPEYRDVEARTQHTRQENTVPWYQFGYTREDVQRSDAQERHANSLR